MQLSFLIAAPDASATRRLARALEGRGARVLAAPTAEEAASTLGKGPLDACLLDAELPERLALARALVDRGMVVVLMGRRPLADVEPELTDGLASEILEPGADAAELDSLLQRVTTLRRLLGERDELRTATLEQLGDFLRGSATATTALNAALERVAGTPRTTVLLQGEPGSRKDLLARAVHCRSVRRRAPLRTLEGRTPRRGTFSRHLAELWGTAARGTLVISEVSELDLAAQHELTRVLADPPGDVRLVATTSVDLEPLAGRGRFSEDLLYRLNVLTVAVPSLRERREDLPELARRLLARYTPAGAVTARLGEPAEAALLRYDWPGNLRELEACMVRAALAANGGTVHPGHLGLPAGAAPHDQNGTASLPLENRSLRALEEALIRRVLTDEGGNRSRAARILGINRSTLYNKLRQYGIRE